MTWMVTPGTAKRSIRNAIKTLTGGGIINIADGVYEGEDNTLIIIRSDISIVRAAMEP